MIVRVGLLRDTSLHFRKASTRRMLTSVTTPLFGVRGGTIISGLTSAAGRRFEIAVVPVLLELRLLRRQPIKANIGRKRTTADIKKYLPVEEGAREAYLGSRCPRQLGISQGKLAEALKKEDERKREEQDERRQKYKLRWNNEVTPEDMEAYRRKRIHHDDPMKDFLS